jgi:hypothetical protein
MASEPLPAVEFIIPGRAVTKKTSQNVIFPAIAGLDIWKSPRHLARDRRARPGRRVSKKVVGIVDLFYHLSDLAHTKPLQASALAKRAAERVRPIITQKSDHERWVKSSLVHARSAVGPRPAIPEGHLAEVEVVIFLERGQSGDLINFQQAVWDFLEKAGFVPTDGWINHHRDSRKEWSDPTNPRVEIRIWDGGKKTGFVYPQVRIFGLAAFKARPRATIIVAAAAAEPEPEQGTLLAAVLGGAGVQVDSTEVLVEPGSNRGQLLRAVMKAWQRRFGERLPDGAVLRCAEPLC